MKGIITILILVAITTFPSCFTFDPTPTNLTDLPSFTTEGRNTFGCILNGKTIYNDYEENVNATYNTANNDLNVWANIGDKISFDVTIPGIKRGTFNIVIDENDTINTGRITSYDDYCTHLFGKEGKPGNVLNLHVRRFDRKVIAGTFSMMATDSCGNVDLKQGRFDVELR
jgi:hypothetical protein